MIGIKAVSNNHRQTGRTSKQLRGEARDVERESSDQQRYPALNLDDEALLQEIISLLSSSVSALANPYSDDNTQPLSVICPWAYAPWQPLIIWTSA
jgi:hypothetical protein